MAKCLIAWELGGGFGHLITLKPIIDKFLKAGHEVHMAARDLCRSKRVFGDANIQYLQAPHRLQSSLVFPDPINFAQILDNIGFGCFDELSVLVSAWKSIYASVSPDLIVVNHSPTAILASRLVPAKCVVVGTGFHIPPNDASLPSLRPWKSYSVDKLEEHENRLVERVNRVLERFSSPPLTRISGLFSQCCENVYLTTFSELDHYQRDSANYWGCWTDENRTTVTWPPGDAPKIFCYLKPFPGLKGLIDGLKQLECPTVLCFDGPVDKLRRYSSSESINITSQLADLHSVGREADAAVIACGHGTTASLLLSGIPLLLIPNHLEQLVTARNVVRLGAGMIGDRNNPEYLQQQLHLFLQCKNLGERAAVFAEKYEGFESRRQAELLAQDIENKYTS